MVMRGKRAGGGAGIGRKEEEKMEISDEQEDGEDKDGIYEVEEVRGKRGMRRGTRERRGSGEEE